MLRTRQEWEELAFEEGTSGEMVIQILKDWKETEQSNGLLLCAVCENQLTVRPYKGNHGFSVVEPCHHCKVVSDY